MKIILTLISSIYLTLISCPSVAANRNMIEGGVTTPQFAGLLFCKKNPVQCDVSSSIDDTVVMNDKIMNRIISVNSRINSSITPVSDFGDKDLWSVNVSQGDCEDFALTKRSNLIQMGFPARAIRVAVTKTIVGEGHAVLVISTTIGDIVLDNRDNIIRFWFETDLTWIKIWSKNDPKKWVTLN